MLYKSFNLKKERLSNEPYVSVLFEPLTGEKEKIQGTLYG
jgi:hypothetical protein